MQDGRAPKARPSCQRESQPPMAAPVPAAAIAAGRTTKISSNAATRRAALRITTAATGQAWRMAVLTGCRLGVLARPSRG